MKPSFPLYVDGIVYVTWTIARGLWHTLHPDSTHMYKNLRYLSAEASCGRSSQWTAWDSITSDSHLPSSHNHQELRNKSPGITFRNKTHYQGGHEGHAGVNQRLSPISSKRCIIILRTKESFGNRLLICQMVMEDYEALVKPLYIFVCGTWPTS